MKKLAVLGTPIGNLEDMTLRGLRFVFESDYILAEDTRVYSKLKGLLKERYLEILKSLNIDFDKEQSVLSYREQNHKKVLPKILSLFNEDEKIVTLVSDAGIPAISDPGYRLIDELLKKNIEIEVIPGPTSIETALVASGLPTDRFIFLGFLPRKRGKMISLLRAQDPELTTIFFESPFRVIKTLEIIEEEFGENVKVAACNDLTKKFEKVHRGFVKEVLKELKSQKIKGEWVVCMNLKSTD